MSILIAFVSVSVGVILSLAAFAANWFAQHGLIKVDDDGFPELNLPERGAWVQKIVLVVFFWLVCLILVIIASKKEARAKELILWPK